MSITEHKFLILSSVHRVK